MSVAHLSLMLACLLPIVCAGIAKWGSFSKAPGQGGYDNRDPRAWLARQSGFRARANAAQANSFEALPVFIAALWVAQQRSVSPGLVDGLALAFVLLRVVYIALYLSNRALWRSIVWMLALGTNLTLFLVPAA